MSLPLIPLSTNYPIAGRLKHFLPNWERITQDLWVLQDVKGYLNIIFRDTSPSVPAQADDGKCRGSGSNRDRSTQTGLKGDNPSSSTRQYGTGVFKHTFLVPKKGDERRPVVNLKPLNHMIPYEHFKMEGIHMLKDLLRKGDYLVKIVLKDAYLTVPVWRKHQKHLRFL